MLSEFRESAERVRRRSRDETRRRTALTLLKEERDRALRAHLTAEQLATFLETRREVRTSLVEARTAAVRDGADSGDRVVDDGE